MFAGALSAVRTVESQMTLALPLALSQFDESTNAGKLKVYICPSYNEADVHRMFCLRAAFHVGVSKQLFLNLGEDLICSPVAAAIKQIAATLLEKHYSDVGFGCYKQYELQLFAFDEDLTMEEVASRIIDKKPVDELRNHKEVEDAKTLMVLHNSDGYGRMALTLCCLCRLCCPCALCVRKDPEWKGELHPKASALYAILVLGAVVALLLILLYKRISNVLLTTISIIDLVAVTGALMAVCRRRTHMVINTKVVSAPKTPEHSVALCVDIEDSREHLCSPAIGARPSKNTMPLGAVNNVTEDNSDSVSSAPLWFDDMNSEDEPKHEFVDIS